MQFSLFNSVAVVAMSSIMLCTQARAETIWAKGVTLEGGWFDCNKAYNPCIFYDAEDAVSAIFPDNDSNLCWTASSSNVLLYLMDQQGLEIKRSSTYNKGNTETIRNIVNGVHQYEVFETFTRNFKNVGDNPLNALSWYTTGSIADDSLITEEPVPYELPLKNTADGDRLDGDKGGYYADYVGSTASDFNENVVSTFYTTLSTNNPEYYLHIGDDGSISVNGVETTYVDLFRDALTRDGAMLLNITQDDDAEMGHALTCWGIETDENGNIIGIYITDSDDGLDRMVKLVAKEENGNILLGADADGIKAPVYNADGEIIGHYEAFDYSGYAVDEFGSLKNFFALVPEPSTATMSLLGLGAMILRRRRR